MANRRRFCLIMGLALAVPGELGHAQEATTAWVAAPGSSNVRMLGLGGAFVGLADDSGSVVLNPAGLTTLPRSLEILGDTSADDWSPSGLSAALRPAKRWGFGFQWTHAKRLSLEPTGPTSLALPPSARVNDFALGAAFDLARPGEFSFGTTLRVSHLKPQHGAESSTAASVTAGFLFRPLNAWSPRIGLSYRHPLKWQGPGDGGVGSYNIRSPEVWSAGASWHYEPWGWHILFTVQPEYVWYSKLPSGVEGIQDGFEFRAGTEITKPLGCWTGCGDMLQLRVATIYAGPSPFASLPRVAPENADRRWTLAAGAAWGIGGRLHGRLKLEVAWDQRSDSFAFGVGFRFPQAFRGGIVDDSRQ
jgi:long-subunit fatty acid transport protein